MYYALNDFQFWLYGVISLIAVITSCYFPGWLTIKSLNISSKLSEVLLSIVTGLVLWSFQAVVFGYLQIRFITYIYLVLVLFFIWKSRKEVFHSLKAASKELVSLPKVVLIALLIAVFFQVYAQVGSGLKTDSGVGFYFVYSVDGVMHLCYIQSMAEEFPPVEPGYAGKQLENYHYWGDLVLAEFVRIWDIPVIHLFFQYAPIQLIIITSLLLIQLIRTLKGSWLAQNISLFLITFGSDAAFIISQYFNRSWGNNIAALDTGVSFIFNMPQVFSRIVLLAILLLFLAWTQSRQTKALLLMAALAASLFGFKVYYGLYIAIGLGFVGLYLIVSHINAYRKKTNNWLEIGSSFFKKNSGITLSFLLFAILAAAIFFPTNGNSGGLFYEPLAWSKKFLSVENFNYQDWFLRMQVYEQAGNSRNIIAYNSLAVSITLLAIYGARLLGFTPFGKGVKSFPTEFLWLLIPANSIFMLIGFLFLQTTGGFNIYNFLITPILSFIIFASLSISEMKNHLLKFALLFIVVVLNTPRSYFQFTEYAQRYSLQKPDYVVSAKELELLNQLSRLEKGTVQADTGNNYEHSTPYVSFFSNQQTHLGGENLIKMEAQLIENRRNEMMDLFSSPNDQEVSKKMSQNHIDYLYITSPEYVDKFTQLMVNSTTLEIVAKNEKGMVISNL
ncbi:MAG: hypothetical protein QG639_470 [Patescibacteria group bacterium]|nr:hypothetical protein [Patescibacteria group bacterium]